MPFSEASIEAEYQRLNHTLGWRFLTCPERNIRTASVALVTINPAGGTFEPPKWSVEAGSAYAIECWKGYPPGQEKLQRQVLRMFQVMQVTPDDVLSGYLVPFRSPEWKTLARKSESLRFGTGLWREVFKRANVRTVMAFGKDTAPYIATILAANFQASHQAWWGAQTIDEYMFGSRGKLIVLPHLSRYGLFGRPQSESAFRSVVHSWAQQRPKIMF